MCLDWAAPGFPWRPSGFSSASPFVLHALCGPSAQTTRRSSNIRLSEQVQRSAGEAAAVYAGNSMKDVNFTRLSDRFSNLTSEFAGQRVFFCLTYICMVLPALWFYCTTVQIRSRTLKQTTAQTWAEHTENIWFILTAYINNHLTWRLLNDLHLLISSGNVLWTLCHHVNSSQTSCESRLEGIEAHFFCFPSRQNKCIVIFSYGYNKELFAFSQSEHVECD